ncbi:hypothetical protein DXG03_003004 [Asterophora parasitica]|uniref:DUF6699 domain-containing protein n=1 Tax=Asterophora parasitica TaxID=117018 RepID=A0A9P7KAP9_9AGAR|nr:hypothetical protein DXG03_003004 [Asterophora parasitica]
MSQGVTPFVPSPFLGRMSTPSDGPPPPVTSPVVPDHPEGAPIGWAAEPQHAGAYPNYPTSPYTPGFIPTRYATPGKPLDPFLPPAPGAYYPIPPGPPSRAELDRAVMPNGFSLDWTGYPPATPAATAAPIISNHPQAPPALRPPNNPHSAPPSIYAQTPYYPPPAQLHPMQGAHWRQYPNSAGPYGAFSGYPQQGFQGYPGWGTYATPVGPHMMNLDGWGFQSAGFTPAGWAQQAPQPQQQQPQQVPGMRRPGQPRDGDRVDQFAAGPHYGPVLDPFLIKVVNAETKVNPLLEPLPDDGTERPHLKWNMLFESNNCQRSTDPSHISWSAGRDAPATFPRVTSLNIISETFPWMITIRADKPNIGVTCGEVIDSLSDGFQLLTPREDYDALPKPQRQIVGQTYRHNRSREPGVPGGRLGEGMRRLDFLGMDTTFGGIYKNDRLVQKIVGAPLPCTFVLKCVRRYALTVEEIKQHEEKEKAKKAEERRRKAEEDAHHAAAEAEARRRKATGETEARRRKATVETVTDDGD